MSDSNCSIIIKDAILSYPIGPHVKASLKSAMIGMFGKREKQSERGTFRALNGLNLTIKAGERVGIIGRNGAGKSTLLRAIAGIYPLESGSITVNGKIQSLFDINLGFEVDSTGRENIAYRGLSMGCKPEEILAREEDIIAFANIGNFIDMPIRTYSAGMFVRLAFAISTYLDGDILLIDEVFGTGDAAFRDKAVKRMEDIVQRSTIMLFVSHDLDVMKRMCSRIIWINDGRICADGPPAESIKIYLDEVEKNKAA